MSKNSPVPFTEELYEKISAYEDQYTEGDIKTSRDGCLLFFAGAKNRQSILDCSFVSDLGNYREPFRDIRFAQIMEHTQKKKKPELIQQSNLSLHTLLARNIHRILAARTGNTEILCRNAD